MGINLGNKVSRVLDNKNRNFAEVVFQQKRPPLDSEWNLVQEVLSTQHLDLIRKLVPSGFLKVGSITTAPEQRDILSPNWKNVLKFKSPIAIVNGWMINVGGGTNQFQQNAQKNIWEDLSKDLEEIVYITKDGPQTGFRQDLIFLEVFQKLVGPSDIIYQDGFTQSALNYLSNDIMDPNIEIETSRRVQIQYSIRYTTGVDFISYRDGLGFPGCYAKGASPTEKPEYTFKKHPTDPGLYIAGDGSTNAQQQLSTVDGYSYAIPIMRIHKRNRTTWSLSNQNGSLYSITSGVESDRPDKLFYDEVNSKDIEDLRHTVSFSGHDYETLMEENLNLLWTKKLPSELKNSTLDESVAGSSFIYVDGISATSLTGVDTAGRTPNGGVRVFSDGREKQVISYFISSPSISGNQVIFTPIGYNSAGSEYALFDEIAFYVSSEIPTVLTYNNTTNTISTVLGGTWQGLGEVRTWNYTTGTRNKVIYTPQNVSDIQNKQVLFLFDLIHREGGGLDGQSKGFKYLPSKILSASNNYDGRPIDFNLYSEDFTDVQLNKARVTQGHTDTAISRSIRKFEESAVSLISYIEKYKASTLEIKYYKVSDGSVEDIIPLELYGRTVLGIFQVFNQTQQIYVKPSQTKVATGIKLTNLIVGTGDIVEYTILLGNYMVDYVPHVKGIRNIAKPYVFPGSAINLGERSGIINAKVTYPTCDGVLATVGFFDGSQYRHTAFINSTLVYLSSIEGLGTPVIKYTLDPNEYPNGSPIAGSFTLYGIGYYNPISTDSFYFQYEHNPYAGIIRNRLSYGEMQKVTVVKADDKIAITTAGTGHESQYLPQNYKGLTETLPINKVVFDFNLLGQNIETPLTGGNSSLRRIPGRWLATMDTAEPLREGQIINITVGLTDKEMLRGAIIDSPKLVERGLDFSIPFNHLTQWSAIVRGMGIYEGELFLMVITTVSSIYNASEGSTYEYLAQNGTYSPLALGKGSETILDNTLVSVDLSQNLGNKIFGAVDIFPLKGRPLEY